MTLLQAIILGIVQGLTEFIPVSSTAHLVIAGRVMKLALTPEQLTASIAVVQLGTLIAVLIYFAGDIWNITRAFIIDHFALLMGKRALPHRPHPSRAARLGTPGRASPPEARAGHLSHDAWLAWLVIIGSIRGAVLVLLLENKTEGAL